VNEIFSAKHRFNEDERNEIVHKVFEHDKLQSFLLNYAQNAKKVKKLQNVLYNVKTTYALLIRVARTWSIEMHFFL
jgi:hypothetical protein